ncbi:MAG: hypothetical protein ACQCN4_00425 [Candidatus Bathyarchaeia archaeon]
MTFKEDVEYYQRIAKDLAKQHNGKYVLIKNKTNIGIFSSFEDAHKEALKRFGNTEVLIAHIEANPPINYLAPVM